jgi:hypothetical protein
MLESILPFVFSYYAIAVLFFLSVIFEHNGSRTLSVVSAIALVYIVQHMYSLTMYEVITLALGYLPVGLIWSVWRWRSSCLHIVKEQKGEYENYHKLEEDLEAAKFNKKPALIIEGMEDELEKLRHKIEGKEYTVKAALRPSDNIAKIMCWVLNWPVGALTYLLSDVFDVFERFVRNQMIGIYNRVSANAEKELDDLRNGFNKE